MGKPTPNQPRLLSIQDAAVWLGINKRTLYRMIADKCFPRPIKVGSSSRVPVEDLEEFVDRQIRERNR